MKYQTKSFIQIPRTIFNEENIKLSASAKVLFLALKEMEHRFIGKSNSYDTFFCSNESLAKLSDLSIRTIQNARKELEANKLIEHWTDFYYDKQGNVSSQPISYYRLI